MIIYIKRKKRVSKSPWRFGKWTKINVQKRGRRITSPKMGVFFAYVDKSEIRQIIWLHNFFFWKYIFCEKGLGIIFYDKYTITDDNTNYIKKHQ